VEARRRAEGGSRRRGFGGNGGRRGVRVGKRARGGEEPQRGGESVEDGGPRVVLVRVGEEENGRWAEGDGVTRDLHVSAMAGVRLWVERWAWD